MKKIYNIALIALTLLLIVGCEQHFWADDEVIEQTSTISIKPSGGTPAYEYTIYPELRTIMEWSTSSSINSYNPIYSYIDNSTEVDGVSYYNIEFVESRYDNKGNETQYFYEIVQSPAARSSATSASDSSVGMVVTNLTTDTEIVNITGVQITQSMAAVTAVDLAEQSGEGATSEEVTLDERRVTLSVGEPLTLVAMIGDKVATSSDVTWSSDHEEYVTVSAEGVITALAVGKSNITVTTIDGGNKALCTITVVVKMESITITPETKELAFGEGVDPAFTTFTVAKTAFAPENATTPATEWKSSDESIATVSADGLVTAVTAGKVDIYAASTDGSGVESNHCVVTIKAAQSVESITISGAPENSTMERGGTLTLLAAVLPENATNQAVVWSSSNDDVISVTQEGVITALNAGTATITATAKDGSEKSGLTEVITVVIPITNIAISGNSTELEVGEEETLTCTLTPAETTDTDVEWKSSNTDVATIDQDGKVTAIKVGETTISVTSKNDSNQTASYILKVIAKTIKVSSVTLSEDQVIQYSNGATATITATVKEDNADNKSLDWESSDNTIATVDDNGTVTALKAGEVTIAATAADGSGKSDECKILFCSAEIPATLSAPINECTTPISNTTQITITSVFGSQTPTNVSWVSSKTDVATVDANGLVTSLTSGSTTITYKATLGAISIEESCEVTVLVKSFPDAKFRELLGGLCNVESDSDGISLTAVNQTALNTITILANPNTAGVTDATGIAYLTKLTSFTAASNFKPTTLDLSKNVELTTKVELNGMANSSVLKSIVLGNLTKLKLLTLKNHKKLTSIDISGCSALTTVNVTGCSGLTTIKCTSDQQNGITFTGFTAKNFEVVTTED